MTGVMKTLTLVVSLMLKVGYSHEAGAACKTVSKTDTEEPSKTCYRNVMWAKTTGTKISDQQAKYTNIVPTVNENSSIAIFQCILDKFNHKGVEAAGHEGHNCTMPCGLDEKTCAPVTPAPAPAADTKAPAPKKDAGGGMPGYAWVLIVLGVCCGLPCLGIMCSAFLCYEAVAFILDPICGGKKGAQKKKRAVKKPAEAEPAAVVPTPVVTTSVPMPVYHAAPQMTYTAAPVYVEAPATSYHVAPASMSYAAPMAYAPASVSYAAPVAYAAPAEYAAQAATYPLHDQGHPYSLYAAGAEPVSAFDQNRDGVITQQEFSAAMR